MVDFFSPPRGTFLSPRPPRPFALASKWARGAIALSFSLATALYATSSRADASSLPPEVGYNYGEMETPRITALGGALRATSHSTSALYLNPANMARGDLYRIEAAAQIYPEARRQSYGAAVVDSVISSWQISGGFAANWSLQDPKGVNRRWADIRFGLAIGLGDHIYLGMAGKSLALKQDGTTPLGASEFDPIDGGLFEKNIVSTVTFDAGLTVVPVPQFAIAVTGHNLTNRKYSYLPMTGGLGIGFSDKDFSLSADAVIEKRTFEETTFRFMGGGEYLAANVLAIRAGYRYDDGLLTHAISGGLGYVAQEFSVDASVRHGVSGQRYTAIVFGFTLHIEAMGVGR